jgi:hypothetical protein
MTVHQYPTDFSSLTWSDLPSLSAGDTVDGGGATFTATLTPGTSGSSGNPITFRNFKINGAGSLANCLSVAGNDYIILENLYLYDSTADGLVQGNTTATADHLVMKNVHVHGAGNDGFQLGHSSGGACTNLVANGLTASECTNVGLVMWNSPNAVLTDLRIVNCGSTGNLDGIAIDNGCEGSIIQDVVVSGQKSGACIDIQDSTGSDPIILRRVHCHSPGNSVVDGVGCTGTSPVQSSQILVDGYRYNFYSKSLVAHTVSNLTSINATEYGVRLGVGTDGQLDLKNSIIDNSTISAIRINVDITTGSVYTGDYNIFGITEDFHFGGAGNKTLAQWLTENTSQDTNSQQVSPNIYGPEYKTEFTSPGYRAGVSISGLHDTVNNGSDSWGDKISIGLDDNGYSRRRYIRRKYKL